MSPREVSKRLVKIASYLESNSKPDRKTVLNALQEISNGLHTAADVKKFIKKDFDKAADGFQKLIERLDSVAHSMNPQDPQRPDLEGSIEMFEKLQKLLTREFQSINVQV